MDDLIRCATRGIFLALLLAGCAATTTTSTVNVSAQVLDASARYEVAYLLQPGDQIEVFVYRQPDFSRKAVIRPDGFISLPLLGDVRAASKAPVDLSEELVKLYASRLKDPKVTVIVENPPEPMVYVFGDTGATKAVPLRQARTAAQAIAHAGNLSRTADSLGISIVRLDEEGRLVAHTIETEEGSQPEVFMALQNFALKSNDLIVIPESYRSQIARLFADINTIILPYFQYRLLFELAK